jgi:hypothetical protein
VIEPPVNRRHFAELNGRHTIDSSARLAGCGHGAFAFIKIAVQDLSQCAPLGAYLIVEWLTND